MASELAIVLALSLLKLFACRFLCEGGLNSKLKLHSHSSKISPGFPRLVSKQF